MLATLNRRVLIAAVSTLTIGMPLVPAPAVESSRTRRKISETHAVITIGSQGKPGPDSLSIDHRGRNRRQDRREPIPRCGACPRPASSAQAERSSAARSSTSGAHARSCSTSMPPSQAGGHRERDRQVDRRHRLLQKPPTAPSGSAAAARSAAYTHCTSRARSPSDDFRPRVPRCRCERAKPAEGILVDAEWTCCVGSGWVPRRACRRRREARAGH